VPVLLLPSGCRSASGAPPDVITVALANSPLSLDPRVEPDEASQKLHQLLYDSLFTVGDDLQLEPDLATSIEAAVAHVAEPGFRAGMSRPCSARIRAS
jgi:ABC-type transport system substrate-binding protein